MKKTVITLKNKKQNKEKITALTAYDYHTAKLIDEEGIDIILVGDSLAMVFAGYEDTLSVTMEDMLYHTKIVSRATVNSMVIADMPFMSYHVCKEDAIYNAGRFLKEAGANAVKLEGGKERADTIKAIIDCGIPVLGHLGLLPQSVNQIGGYKVCGKEKKEQEKLLEDAKILQDTGCFAIVLECIPYKTSEKITNSINIPTIGIGSGMFCDGQILVVNDLLGFSNKSVPKFVKKYADTFSLYKKTFAEYKQDVTCGKFPSKNQCYS